MRPSAAPGPATPQRGVRLYPSSREGDVRSGRCPPPPARPVRRSPQVWPHSGAAGVSAQPGLTSCKRGATPAREEPRGAGGQRRAAGRAGQRSAIASGRRGRLSGAAARRRRERGPAPGELRPRPRCAQAPPPARSGSAPGAIRHRPSRRAGAACRAPPGGALSGL